jgi:hypothetical protein
MATPSSQVVAHWVKQDLNTTSWESLSVICTRALTSRWIQQSQSQIAEFVESNLTYIADHLRAEISDCMIDGTAPRFEIDNEVIPYIRLIEDGAGDLIAKLRKIDPFKLEELCSDVLIKFGAEAKYTKKTNDGGIDFEGFGLQIVPLAFGLPASCKAAIIGQTKRYKEGHPISEVRLREFVGAATLRRHRLQREGKIGPLTPVVFAFWTTSDFDPGAKRYAREIGLWYMEGRTLAKYAAELGMRDAILALPVGP